MEESDSAVELEKTLLLLSESFYQELKKIAEQRLKLENENIQSVRNNLVAKSGFVRKAADKPKTFTICLEPSLGEKLAKSRSTADELEDKLQESRIAFEDKLKTVDRMKNELDRRENILISSSQQIEAYMRVVFYLKGEAEKMYSYLQYTTEEQSSALNQLKNDVKAWKTKKDSVLNATNIFLPALVALGDMAFGIEDFTSNNLVDYYLVLRILQQDLLDHEAECIAVEESLAADKQKIAEFKRRIPMIVVAKESIILDLKSKLKNLRSEIAHLEEQIDTVVVSKVKADTAWYDIQRWIKKLFFASIEIRPLPPEDKSTGILNMLDRLKDFTTEGLEILERLKEKKDV